MAHNSTLHSTTKRARFELLYGRDPISPVHFFFGLDGFKKRRNRARDTNRIVENLKENLPKLWKIAAEATTTARIKRKKSRQRTEQNKLKNKAKRVTFDKGDKVWTKGFGIRGRAKKLSYLWAGPFSVLKRKAKIRM